MAARLFHALAAAAIVSVPALAHEPPPDARDLRAWLDQHVQALDAPDFQAREKASEAISAEPDLSITLIFDALRVTTLTPEQRSRLTEAGYRRFAQTDRAALGVSFATFASDLPGVEITQTIEGFDAINVIHPGDVLVSLEDARIESFDQARVQIVSYDPGVTVRLGLLRLGEPVTVAVRLGSLSTLRGGNSAADQSLLRGAWNARLARTGLFARDDGMLDPGISPERWADLNTMTDLAQYRAPAPRGVAPTRLAPDGIANPARQMMVAPGRVVAGGNNRGADYYAIAEFALTAQQRTRTRNDFLQRQVDELRVQIKIRQSQLLAERLPDRIRAQLEQQIRDARAKLDALQAEQRKVGGGQVEP